jgi:hypothetical protein
MAVRAVHTKPAIPLGRRDTDLNWNDLKAALLDGLCRHPSIAEGRATSLTWFSRTPRGRLTGDVSVEG